MDTLKKKLSFKKQKSTDKRNKQNLNKTDEEDNNKTEDEIDDKENENPNLGTLETSKASKNGTFIGGVEWNFGEKDGTFFEIFIRK